MNKLTKATLFAANAHKDQKRKYTGEPYINHPISVMELASRVTDDIDMLCAAVLHDVVEDCDIELKAIDFFFGFRVANMVCQLTDISQPSDGNRACRKALDREYLSSGLPETKTIKLADLIDNAGSIESHDKKFAAVYMAEMKLLLEVLTEGDPSLYSMAKSIVDRYYEE